MIYQCYFKREHEESLFVTELYRGFGLEPEVNPSLLDACQELADPSTRLALCEYSAFLHIWRHLPFDADSWIGFTSYRQLAKSGVVFESKAQIERLLLHADFLAWHVWSIGHERMGELSGAAAQAEIAHSALHAFTIDVLETFGVALPDAYFTTAEAPYANYWVLSKQRFEAFMAWSWPIAQHALRIDHPYKTSAPRNARDDKRRAVGYFLERLFIIWTMRVQLRGKWLGTLWRFPPKTSMREFVFGRGAGPR